MEHKIDISNKEKEILNPIINNTAYTINLSEFLGRSLLQKQLEKLPDEKPEKLRVFKHFKNSVEEYIQQHFISKDEIKMVIEDIREYIEDEISYKRVLLTINRLREKYTLNDVQEKFVAFILGAAYISYHIDVLGGEKLYSQSFGKIVDDILTFFGEETAIAAITSLFMTSFQLIPLVVAMITRVAKEHIKNKDKDKWVENLLNEI